MKTFKILSVAILATCLCNLSFAQAVKKESFKVSGECGMCKKKIEKAAKTAGAVYAVWSTETKVLTVKYNSASTNAAKIQHKIADAGYDTPGFKATEEAYSKLDDCCQYEREGVTKEMNCCGASCEMSAGSGGKDGKCADEAACKEKGCCKDSEKCKEMGCCGNEAKAGVKASCCDKDSKMDCGTKGCCKKS